MRDNICFSLDVSQALFQSLIPSLDVDLNVFVILIAKLVTFVTIKNALRNLTLATLHLVDPVPSVWSIRSVIQFAGKRPFK
jgi:hypothetical protein